MHICLQMHLSLQWVIAEKVFGINNLMKLDPPQPHSMLSLADSTIQLCSFHYIAMLFGATVVGDVFQHKLDECFGKIEQVIIIADDIMIVGYKPDHSDHDQAFTTLLQTAKKYNVKLNYDNLQSKQIKWQQLHLCHHKPIRSKYNPLLAWFII